MNDEKQKRSLKYIHNNMDILLDMMIRNRQYNNEVYRILQKQLNHRSNSSFDTEEMSENKQQNKLQITETINSVSQNESKLYERDIINRNQINERNIINRNQNNAIPNNVDNCSSSISTISKQNYRKMSKTNRQKNQTKTNSINHATNRNNKTKRNNLANKFNTNVQIKQQISMKKSTLKKCVNSYDHLQQKDKSALDSASRQWMRSAGKVNKKLSRVNICRLHQNAKHIMDIHPRFKQAINLHHPYKQNKKTLKNKKMAKLNTGVNLKLNFELGNKPVMERLIQQKQIQRQYSIARKKYRQAAECIEGEYLKQLESELRYPSQEVVLKLKICAIILCFFSQFTNKGVIAAFQNCLAFDFSFQTLTAKIIKILHDPYELLQLVRGLPKRLYEVNVVSNVMVEQMLHHFDLIDVQLDSELQLFLIKKTKLYVYLHQLTQYIQFLLEKELLQKTDRKAISSERNPNAVRGYYSSRSKRDRRTRKSGAKGACDSELKTIIKGAKLLT